MTNIGWAEGIALRYGGFYGPGTGVSAAPDAVMAEQIRARKFPIVGGGGGVWSLVHIDDAASATVAAIERGKPGIYHVADDEPSTGTRVASGTRPSARRQTAAPRSRVARPSTGRARPPWIR
ncbi:NAD-dependent epimerase/dehydratase family protein [Streptomyces lasalocidi]